MPDPQPQSDTNMQPDRESSGGTSHWQKLAGISRWQKVIGIIALILILLFVVLQVTGVGGGDHVPGPPPGGH